MDLLAYCSSIQCLLALALSRLVEDAVACTFDTPALSEIIYSQAVEITKLNAGKIWSTDLQVLQLCGGCFGS
ncbi:hypothetical protein F5X99DRAFT_407484 [Biscogniauxia marginata]|nr:hypothetical protein F5X99DRAFT_407484 [Biscogniauxia marginata]